MMVLQQTLIVDNLLKKKKDMENIIGCSMVDIRGVETLEQHKNVEKLQHFNNLVKVSGTF